MAPRIMVDEDDLVRPLHRRRVAGGSAGRRRPAYAERLGRGPAGIGPESGLRVNLLMGGGLPDRHPITTLNLLDDFGFAPGQGVGGYFRGDPLASHPCLYDEVVAELAGSADTSHYVPSAESATIRRFVEDHYDDFIGLLVILAATEETAIVVCPAMRCGSEAVGVDVNRGYYMVHGSSEDEGTNAFDDDHQNDIMFVLSHAMNSHDHLHAMRVAQQYCDLWQRFWDRAWRVHQPHRQLASGS